MVPAAQLVHTAAPAAEYVPRAQTVHAEDAAEPTAATEKPGAHAKQLVALEAAW
jgi:hypothetical protein